MGKVGILIPTYNEAKALPNLIQEIRELCDCDVIVVDSNSNDGTVDIAKDMADVVIVVKRRGKAFAVSKAFELLDHDKIIMMDGDGTYSPKNIPTILDRLKSCDVVIGSRFVGNIEKGAMSFVNLIGNKLLTMLANLLFNSNISDLCSGMWGFRKSFYKSFKPCSFHFDLEADLFSFSVKNNFKLCEVPIVYRRRIGHAKLNVLHGVGILILLIKRKIGFDSDCSWAPNVDVEIFKK